MAVSRRSALLFLMGAKPHRDNTFETARRWGLVIDLRKCVGCQACMVACGFENSTPLGHFRTTVTISEKVVEGVPRRVIVPRTCNQCADPACVKVCPTGATYQQEEGVVVVDNTVCIGCGYCAQTCPYEARFINPISHTADKCTFCVHRLQVGLLPACVETCVGGARVFGDLNDPGSQVSVLLSQYDVQVLKPGYRTEPKVYYIGLQNIEQVSTASDQNVRLAGEVSSG